MTTRHGPTAVFERVVCAVDPSGAAHAVRIAGRTTDPDGTLAVVTVADGTAIGGARTAAERAQREAERFHRAGVRVLEGDVAAALLAELERSRATLVVVGSHALSRVAGRVLGSVATRLLHDAPCSVLVARGSVPDTDAWPRSIAVGLDGSVTSARAAAAAWELADRAGARLRSLVATRGADPDLDAARRIAPDVELVDERPLPALVAASGEHDLVVVGSRGLSGVRALGSVSERLGHRARCPVLVVRER